MNVKCNFPQASISRDWSYLFLTLKTWLFITFFEPLCTFFNTAYIVRIIYLFIYLFNAAIVHEVQKLHIKSNRIVKSLKTHTKTQQKRHHSEVLRALANHCWLQNIRRDVFMRPHHRPTDCPSFFIRPLLRFFASRQAFSARPRSHVMYVPCRSARPGPSRPRPSDCRSPSWPSVAVRSPSTDSLIFEITPSRLPAHISDISVIFVTRRRRSLVCR